MLQTRQSYQSIHLQHTHESLRRVQAFRFDLRALYDRNTWHYMAQDWSAVLFLLPSLCDDWDPLLQVISLPTWTSSNSLWYKKTCHCLSPVSGTNLRGYNELILVTPVNINVLLQYSMIQPYPSQDLSARTCCVCRVRCRIFSRSLNLGLTLQGRSASTRHWSPCVSCVLLSLSSISTTVHWVSSPLFY